MKDLTPQQQQQVRNLIPRGMTLSAIATVVKKNQVDVHRYMTSANLVQAFDAQLRVTQVVKAGLNAGLSAEKIAQQHNFSLDMVLKRIEAMKLNALGDIKPINPSKVLHNTSWTPEHDVVLTYLFDVEKLTRAEIGDKLGRTSAAITTRLWERDTGQGVDRPVFNIDNEEHRRIADNFLLYSNKTTTITEQEQILLDTAFDEPSTDEILVETSGDIVTTGEVQFVTVAPDLLAKTIQDLTSQGLRCILVG